ncbi:Uncharacterised protein [Chlamydia trachomatis]|nr:Uncharacterised protein [Chlamydia trachomatis]
MPKIADFKIFRATVTAQPRPAVPMHVAAIVAAATATPTATDVTIAQKLFNNEERGLLIIGIIKPSPYITFKNPPIKSFITPTEKGSADSFKL